MLEGEVWALCDGLVRLSWFRTGIALLKEGLSSHPFLCNSNLIVVGSFPFLDAGSVLMPA